MKTKRHRKCIATLATFAIASLGSAAAVAGGFLVYDQSGEASAKGSAVVANTREPAAIWYNPAGVVLIPGHAFSIGSVMLTAGSTFTPAGGGDDVSAEQGVYFLPHVFGTVRISDWLSGGLGVYSAFGLGTSWPEGWIGRESGISSSLLTATINPTLSFKLHRTFSLGVGFDATRGVVENRNALPEPVGGTVNVAAGGWGMGGNVGALWQVMPDVFHLGLTYRSQARITFTGWADFDPRPEFARALREQGARSSVILPDIITIGMMVKPMPSLEIGLDGNMVLWNTYDRTVLSLDDGSKTVIEHHYRPAFALRAGADWQTPVKGLSVRGGLIYDRTPAPSDYLDPSMPDSDQIDLTAGLGYAWRWLKADLGYQLILFFPAEATTGRVGPEGTYNTIAHFLALTVTFLASP